MAETEDRQAGRFDKKKISEVLEKDMMLINDFEFINLYRALECLYNASTKKYSNRNSKRNAYKLLTVTLKVSVDMSVFYFKNI